MKKIYICIGLIVLITLIGLFIINRNDQPTLYRAVRNHVQEHGKSTVKLEELLNFDFDYALFFDKTNPKAIFEVAGVHFQNTDLTIGMIFIKNGEIIYYELFPQRWRGINPLPSRFSMYGASSLTIFNHDDLFIIGDTPADEQGPHRYWIMPYSEENGLTVFSYGHMIVVGDIYERRNF